VAKVSTVWMRTTLDSLRLGPLDYVRLRKTYSCVRAIFCSAQQRTMVQYIFYI